MTTRELKKSKTAPRGPARAVRAVPGQTLPDGMRYRVVLMSPTEAEAYLGNADKADFKGSVFKSKVARFTEAMAARRWRLNGDSIVVGRSGKVLDGRARLQACVDSQTAFPVILVTNVDDAAYVTIDAHTRRSTTDMLTIDDVEHARVVTSAWQAIASYVNAPRRDAFRYQGSSAVATDEILVLNEAFREEIQRSAEFVAGLKLPKAVPATVATACHYLASMTDPSLADGFFTEMAEAKPRTRSVPALLRRRYETPEANTTFTYRMALFSKAWNSYVTGLPLTMAQLDYKGPVERRGNLGNEAFPPIHGVPDDLRYDFAALRAHNAAAAERTEKGYALANTETVQVVEMEVTPEIAWGFLQANGPEGRNRKIRERHWQDLARLMKARLWRENGKTLKISLKGDMLDGQHRCMAAWKGGVSFRTLVVSGLEPDTFGTIDLGERKTLGKRLAAAGQGSGTQVNSTCTTLWRIREAAAGGEPTSAEAEAIYLADKEAIDRSVAFVKGNRLREVLDLSVAAPLHLLFSREDAGRADAFMTSLAKGENLGPDSPVRLLRDDLMKDAGRSRRLYNRPARKVRAVIKAWNAYVTGAGARKLKLVDETEAGYPAIKGPLSPRD